MPKPDLATIPSFYHRYVNLVKEEDLNKAIAGNTTKALDFLQAIPDDQWPFRYAEDKWSISELVQHLIDAERIFAYRALCFARGEKQSLPGFDENDYAASSNADNRKSDDLRNEFKAVRAATEALYRSFNEDQLQAIGTANKNAVSVAGIGFIIAGHVQHHLNILAERYLV